MRARSCSAMDARSAVGRESASTVVSAFSARSAVGLEYASTVVGATSVRSAVGLEYATTVVCAMTARSAVVHQSAITVVGAITARSAVGRESASTVVAATNARSAVGQQSASTVVGALRCKECGGSRNMRARSSPLSNARTAKAHECNHTYILICQNKCYSTLTGRWSPLTLKPRRSGRHRRRVPTRLLDPRRRRPVRPLQSPLMAQPPPQRETRVALRIHLRGPRLRRNAVLLLLLLFAIAIVVPDGPLAGRHPRRPPHRQPQPRRPSSPHRAARHLVSTSKSSFAVVASVEVSANAAASTTAPNAFLSFDAPMDMPLAAASLVRLSHRT